MKKLVTVVFIFMCFSTILFAQKDGDNTLFGIPKINLGYSTVDTAAPLAGRAIVVIPGPKSLDGDDLTDIIVTDYNYGRVHVFEQVAKNSLDFKLVWSSPKKKIKLSTGSIPLSPQGSPRTVTYGDLDGNGKNEIIFPIGYYASDSIYSDTTYKRGLYFFECQGDNNYGTTPYIIPPEKFDPDVANVVWGRTEFPGLLAADVDGDGKQELLSGTATLSYNMDMAKNTGKAHIMSVKSGTFAQKNVVLNCEYLYTKMAKALKHDSDGYAPTGFTLADLDGDGKDEIIVTARTMGGKGGAVGFIKATGTDQYIDGNIVDITNNNQNIFRVTSQLGKIKVGDRDAVFIKTDESGLTCRVLVLSDVVDISLIGDNNFSIIKQGVFGGFTGGAIGDQDHGTGSDGFDFYFPWGNTSGGLGLYDLEYKGNNLNIADSNSYTMTKIFDATKVMKRCDPGVYEVVIPGIDLNGNGKKEIIVNYQSWDGGDTLYNGNIAMKAPPDFFILEWGDTAVAKVEVKQLRMFTPQDYTLEQNYPNPFNPTTNIQFSIPTAENLDLIIYDINGREVKKLIDNQHYNAGKYEAAWDGKDGFGKIVATGTYIYKLRWGNFEKSMKMSFIK
jgi:hypothetical protein